MLHAMTIYECGVYYPDDTDVPSHSEMFTQHCFYSPEGMKEYARQMCSTFGTIEVEYSGQFVDSAIITDGGKFLLRIQIEGSFDVEHWS